MPLHAREALCCFGVRGGCIAAQAVLASKEAALAQRFATGADAAGWQASRLAALAAENAELRAALNAS